MRADRRFFYRPDCGQSGVAPGGECIFRLEAILSVDMGQPSKAIWPIGVGATLIENASSFSIAVKRQIYATSSLRGALTYTASPA
jgi:hypothetical protein